MPRIPLYNQGQGPAVQMDTRGLGPKLSSQVFERAAAAPGEVASKALRDVAVVAAEFEVREQKAELEAAEADLTARADAAAFDFVMQNNDDNYRAYKIKAGEFQSDWLASNIDTYEGLNKRQRQALSSNLNKRMQLKLQPGQVNAFNRGQARKTDIFNKRGEQLIQDMAAAADSPEMQAKLKEEAEALYDSAIDQGLSIDWTPDGVVLQGERERLIDFTLNPNTSAEQMRQEADLIRGGDGRYRQFTADERAVLGQELTKSLNKLENEEVAIAESNFQGAVSALKLAETGEDRAAAFARGMESVSTLRRAGSMATAETREFELRGFLSATQVFDDIKYATAEEVNDVITDLRSTAIALAKDPNADLKDVRQAEANLIAAKALAAERKAAILEDPAGYVAKTFQAENDRLPTATEMVDIQRKIGVPKFNITPFTTAQFDKLSDELKSLDAYGQMEALQNFFGPLDAAGLGDMAMSQALQSGLTPVQMMAARSLDRGPRARRLVADLLDAEKLFKEDKAIFDALVTKDEQKDLRDEVAKMMGDYHQTVLGADASSLRTTGERVGSLVGMQNAVVKLATYYASQGVDKTKAARNAVQIITGRYEISEAPGGTFNDSKIRIPKEVLVRDGHSNYMRQVMGKYITAPGFLESVVARIEKPDGTPFSDVEMEKYIDEVRLYGSWVTADDDSGVYLIDQKTGSAVILNTNRFGEQGEFRLELNFEDLAELALAIQDHEEETGDLSLMDSVPYLTLEDITSTR